MASVGFTRKVEYPVIEDEKKGKKPKPEPSPWKVYSSGDASSHVAFARIGYWDAWAQKWLVEGRVRAPSGKPGKGWKPVAHLSRGGNLSHPKEAATPSYLAAGEFLDRIKPDMLDETVAYQKRSKDWLEKGGTLRDLNLRMAIENGTWDDGHRPLSSWEVKYD